MFKRILQPVDLSESMSEIKIRSSFIDRFGGEEIILIHVTNPGLGEGKAESRLRHLVLELENIGIKAKQVLAAGSVASEIAAAADNEQADLVYMPASRKNILVSTLMGSVTDDVVRLSRVPVFVHKQRPILKKTEDVDRVIYATDFGEAAKRARPFVAMLGEHVPELIILHVGDRASDPYTEQLRRESVAARLEELEEKYKDDFKQIKHYARIGSPAKHIIDVAEDTEADLVVLGRINEPFPSNVLGSTSSRVASRVKSSVLLIP
ncbi:universal stress protein [Desulfonatronovibrio hydrogenovorans]|uniref:universal stress protein n=1 Tax=Desulfonatronovibrio hydrogenovorans TaxID=53245 RepID=UPI00048A6EE5|nr:universal stress protein [Desulfonatronovibrio hydrogenovorans]